MQWYVHHPKDEEVHSNGQQTTAMRFGSVVAGLETLLRLLSPGAATRAAMAGLLVNILTSGSGTLSLLRVTAKQLTTTASAVEGLIPLEVFPRLEKEICALQASSTPTFVVYREVYPS